MLSSLETEVDLAMKWFRALRLLLPPLLLLPIAGAAHPGGGLIALDANTVVFGDSMYNSVWRLEKGKKPHALMTRFHAHWTVLGLDGHIYSEAFQEMGGALFRVDLTGARHVKIVEETQVNAPVFAVGHKGEIIFQKGGQIVQRSPDGKVTPFRGVGTVAKGDPPLRPVTAYAWGSDGSLFLADGNKLRHVTGDGIIRYAISIEGKLIEPQIWNSTGAPRIWSLAIDSRRRVYAALPDIGEVVRIERDGSQHVVDRYAGGWRVTAVATFGDSVFLLESSDRNNDGQRVRVIRGAAKAAILGQVEPQE